MMRVGSSIILKDSYCYQSYGWKSMRPLGKLQNVIDFLEAYECDEIVILRPIREKDKIELFKKDIEQIHNLKCMTPLSFGGGLRSKEHIDLLHDLPIERLVFSSSFIHKEDSDIISYATSLYGHQAIQCILPFRSEDKEIEIFSSKLNEFIPLNKIDFNFISKLANEIILLDTNNEGLNNKFYDDIIDKINIDNDRLIISGGIGKKNIKIAKNNNIASVVIDNKVLHSEYSIKGYKNA
jgi:imidazole glycerol phosphate synthase subunit HisF